MNRTWKSLIEPCLRLCNAKTIVEIGADYGKGTSNLLNYCKEVDGLLISIDPFPKFDYEKLEEDGHYKLYKDLSLNRLALIKDYDAILIDGDHNWYTVYNELQIIKKVFGVDNLPLIFFHDMEWPYARRDLYYNPDNIPEAYRQPYAQKGIVQGEANLQDEDGFNDHLFNAIYENNPKNGVRTAVEDFLEELGKADVELKIMPVFCGVGVLTGKSHKAIREFLDKTEVIRNLAKDVEKYRNDIEARLTAFRNSRDSKIEEIKKNKIEYENAIEAIKQQCSEETQRGNERNEALLRTTESLLETNENLHNELEKLRKDKKKYEDEAFELSKQLQKTKRTISVKERELKEAYASIKFRIGDAMVKGMRPSMDTLKMPVRIFRLLKEGIKKKKVAIKDSNNYCVIWNKKEYEVEKERILKTNKSNLKLIEMSDTSPLVSIIILNHNGLNNLKILFESFEKAKFYKKFEIVIVDNASTDKSVQFVNGLKTKYDITIIENKKNESFSKANNKGASVAKGEYFLFLNNDIEVTDGWLDELLYAAMNTEMVGAVGARLVYPLVPAGSINSNKTLKIQHAGLTFDYGTYEDDTIIKPFNRANGEDALNTDLSTGDARAVIGVTAAVLLIKQEVFNAVAGFDERYIYGYEDVDICLKLHRKGYKNLYCPRALAFHYEFGTQVHNEPNEVRNRRINNTEVYLHRWNEYLKERVWLDKVENKKIFTQKNLKVAFAVTEAHADATAGDYFTALELATALEKNGYECKYLCRRGAKDWYDVGLDVDIVIAMIDSYDVSKMYNFRYGIETIAWARNWFARWCDKDYIRDYTMILASSKIACDYFRKRIGVEAQLYPIATNYERFEKIVSKSVDEKEAEKYRADYVFTGSYWNVPRDITEIIRPDEHKYIFKVFGENWHKVKEFAPYYKGFVKYNDIPQVYKYSKIVVDDANAVTKEYGAVNSRVFDAIAAGNLVLTNGTIGAKDTFEGLLPSFEDKEEFDNLLEYYLSNEVERKKLVEKLQKFVKENHTYDIRAKQLKDILLRREKRDENKIAIMVPAPRWEEVQAWGDYHFAVAMKKYFERQKYSVEIRILPEWDRSFDGKTVIVLRGLSIYNTRAEHINIMWNISHPDDVAADEYNSYDKVYVASNKWAHKLKKILKTDVEPLLQCSDTEVFYPMDNIVKKNQLLFVGNSRGVFRKIIKDLIPTKYQLSIYGKGWDKLIPMMYVKGENIPNTCLGEAYQGCDILLNDHWDDMREKGFVSNRIYDGLAAGAFIISDEVDDMDVALKECIVTYTDKTDLQNKVKYYMENEKERNEICKRAVALIREQGSFKNRTDIMNGYIKTTKVI